MNYPNLEETAQIENWMDEHLAKEMTEALKLQGGQLIKKVGVLEKGVRIIRWLAKAKEANRAMYEL